MPFVHAQVNQFCGVGDIKISKEMSSNGGTAGPADVAAHYACFRHLPALVVRLDGTSTPECDCPCVCTGIIAGKTSETEYKRHMKEMELFGQAFEGLAIRSRCLDYKDSMVSTAELTAGSHTARKRRAIALLVLARSRSCRTPHPSMFE